MPLKKTRADTRDGMTITTIALPRELHRRLAMAAIGENAAMNVLVREAIEEWLQRRRKGAKGAKHAGPERHNPRGTDG